MNRGGHVAIDTETTGLDRFRDRVLFWSMATENRRFCFPVDLLPIFDPLFRRPDITWILASAKYDMHLLANHGYHLLGDVWDIVVMDALDDDTRAHGLKQQVWNSYHLKFGDFKDLFLNPDTVRGRLNLSKESAAQFKKMGVGEKLLFVYDENPDLVTDYASCDAFFTYLRGMDLATRLHAEELATIVTPELTTLYDYFTIIEVPFTKVLWRMERRGMTVDLDYVKKIDRPMREGILAAEKKIHRACGKKFNVSSTEQLMPILFDEKKGFGLSPVKYTKGGASKPQPSTDEKSLVLLRDRTQPGSAAQIFIDSVLEHRHISKLHGTYVKSIKTLLGTDGRIHCNINQDGARTSRLSSSNPNLQNIPQRNDEYKIRGAFTAPEGRLFVDLDYPQIEFRIGAVLAEEESMMDAIKKGWDIHTANAGNMYPDASYEKVLAARTKKDNKEELSFSDRTMLKYRDGAKTAGLAAFYGTGPSTMAHTLGCTRDEASELIDTFFRTYPNIDGLVRYMHDYAHEFESTYTMLGRIRRLPLANCGTHGLEAQAERQAFNTLVQGSGAEMMKLAMLRVDADPRFRELGGVCVMTIHDELISDAPADTAKEVLEVKRKLMQEPFHWGPIQFDYPVPIDPDGSIAFRWSDAK